MNEDIPVIHIVDEDVTVRQSLMVMVSALGYPIQAHTCPAAFLDIADTLGNACVLHDIGIPNAGGLEPLSRLRETAPDIPIIASTAHGDIQAAVRAMKAGASDFLVKPCSQEALIDAIRQVSAEAGNRQRLAQQRKSLQKRFDLLSKRERQVLEGVVSGLSNKLIAHRLGLSPRTVEVFRASLMSKMNARTLADLVRMTIEGDIAVNRPQPLHALGRQPAPSIQGNEVGQQSSDR